MSRQIRFGVYALMVVGATFFVCGSSHGATVLWSAPGTTVYIDPGEPLEFENPLAGTETLQGYSVAEWLDADYLPGTATPYDDWSANSASVDGDANEVWLRTAGHMIWTNSTVTGTTAAVNFIGDANDGLADVFVDGVLVAQLDMGTSGTVGRACVLVTNLPDTTHSFEVHAVGAGQTLGDDVSTYGAAILHPFDPGNAKWTQLPDLDVTGMDVHASFLPTGLGYVLADDFLCTSTGPITQIRFWGSWVDDRLPLGGDPLAVEFTLSLHDDIPAPPYSKPGNLLWSRKYFPGECEVELFAGNLIEGWFEPPDFYIPFGDTMCWMYTCPGPREADFIQEGTPDLPIVYWLDVQAEMLDPGSVFGWKTSLDHWNDDAVWAMGIDDGNPLPWEELRYPPGHPFFPESIDLAFEIWGPEEPPPPDSVICEPQPPDHPTDYWYQVTRGTDMYCDFHVRVDDPDPCNYSNWIVPSGWFYDVHQVGSEWWASWWDPSGSCANAITGTFTFGFSNSNPSIWSDWTITQGNSPDPYTMILDDSSQHTTEPDGLGYRVHVPSNPDPPAYKWHQTPDLNSTGMDVYANDISTSFTQPVVLADDFLCTERGEIREITVYASWLNDFPPFGLANGAVFSLSLHADDPLGPGWSVPADWLWGRVFGPTEYTVEPCATDLNEGFYFPPTEEYIPDADSICWKYTFFLQPGEFIQEGTAQNPQVYWLDVQYVAFDADPTARFGWKTSRDHWNDDAVWAMGIDGPAPLSWLELIYPQAHPYAGESIDLAFAIQSNPVPLEDKVVCEPQPPDHPTEYWYEVTRATDFYCDFHVRVQDPNPCNYTNWNAPAGWVFNVHQVGTEWWASWWDPTSSCANAITGAFTFRFSNSNPHAWGDWTITQGNSLDPFHMILDQSGLHTSEPDGLGYRVHVPVAPEPLEHKWVQTPDLNTTGMDVYASQFNSGFPEFVVLADDFECTQTGDISEITIWGSWLNDQPPFADPARAAFRLSIHSDNPQGPNGWSMPADWLWGREYLPGQYSVTPCATDLNEGFYYPQHDIYEPNADTICWEYRFPLAPGEFRQTGTAAQPIVYWVDIQYRGVDSDPQAVFGWKTSMDHWNDDAVWAFGEDGPAIMDWIEMRYPQTHPFAGESIDLAFAITSTPCPPVEPPLPEVQGMMKNRYLTVVPTNPGQQTALRVTFVNLNETPNCNGQGYSLWNNRSMWVSNPQTITEQSGANDPTPLPTFTAANLTCTMDCRDWGSLGQIDIFGEGIVPESDYIVQAIDCSCDPTDPANYSAPLPVSTSKYADLAGAFDAINCQWPGPDGIASIPIDTVAAKDKFENQPCSPRKVRADLVGAPPNAACPDQVINVTDYGVETLLGFQGFPYRFCPSAVDPCNATPCPAP